MDTAKAKQAKVKAQQAQALIASGMMGSMPIDPEVQSPEIDMQPADGYVNPYHRMGPMPATVYSAGNMLDGYYSPDFINPEA